LIGHHPLESLVGRGYMRDFSLRLNEILEMAERTPGFFEVEIRFIALSRGRRP
jgi:hypothetical protein